MSMQGRIVLVGGGNMGQALLRGWLAEGRTKEDIRVVEPDDAARTVAESLGVRAAPTLAELPAGPAVDLVVLAIKPQQLESVLPAYRGVAEGGAVFLSIAAGKPLSFYERILGGGAAIVRGMPNTPAAIGRGMTVLTANRTVDAEGRDLCERLMAAVGEVAWVGEEALMDAVTAVSGSGPAYVFLFIECLTEAGVEAGLSRELAEQLARNTVAGAGAYALRSQLQAAELRRQVTSPGGTTEAALEVLMGESALQMLIERAVHAATARGRALA